VRVIVATGDPATASDVVVGEVKPEFLWGPQDEWPAATEFCVVEEDSRRVLNCPAGMSAAAFRLVEARPAATSSWQRDDDAVVLRARTWSQFMRAGFGTPDWVVIASQPEGFHLARTVEFARLYIPVVGLALLGDLVHDQAVAPHRGAGEAAGRTRPRHRGQRFPLAPGLAARRRVR
jgi:hypothetical protein